MTPLAWLLNSRNYMPHGYCYLWQTDTLWLNVGGDLLIALSYMAIPAVLYYFVRKRRGEVPFPWIALLFAAFIFLCGGTHFVDIWTVWNPDYRMQGLLKVITGVVSMATAMALVRVMPLAMRLQTPAQLQREVGCRTAELASSNERLQREIAANQEVNLKLTESEKRFQLASQALSGYIYDQWAGQDHIERSQGFAQITGFSLLEAPPTPAWWASRIHPMDVDRARAANAAAFASGGTTHNCEYRIQHKAGHYVWVWDQAILERDSAGRVTRRIGVVLDVSDRKNAEAERLALLDSEQVARNEAERANRLKDEFLGTLSHELRTPLSTIRSWAHILKTNPADAKQVSSGAEIIERNAQMQAQLIGDLLDMSRIAAGKVRLDVQSVDMCAVVQSAIDTVRQSAEAKRIRIDSILEPIADDFQGDPTRLQQVVWNLLTNAIKFTPKDGRVRISLARVNSHVEVVVSDNGRGITPAFLPEVFQRFRQEDSSANRQYDGLGLGLAIVKQLVELHGGTVRAASEGEGRGASFTVELPIAPVQVQRDANRTHPRGGSQNATTFPRLDGVTVLVVDDQLDSAEGTSRLLQSYGANVFPANSVDGALAVIQSHSVDVIISDIGMPQRDGFDLVRSLKALGIRMPVVALTAFARSEDRSRTMMAGFEAHVSKPADPVELVTAVAAVYARMRYRAK